MIETETFSSAQGLGSLIIYMGQMMVPKKEPETFPIQLYGGPYDGEMIETGLNTHAVRMPQPQDASITIEYHYCPNLSALLGCVVFAQANSPSMFNPS